MIPNVKAELTKSEPSKFHKAILEHVKERISMSRGFMAGNYDRWDQCDLVFQGKIRPPEGDRESREKGEPIQAVVPTTFAQVMTFVSFGFLLYSQNNRQFELKATGEEDYQYKEDVELIIERDLRKSTWSGTLFQYFLDIGKFGMGILEGSWVETYQNISFRRDQTNDDFGATTTTETVQNKRVLKFQGNKVRNISPYKFFPDIRMPFSRMQEGEFVGVEEEYSKTELKRLESNGEIAGVQYIKNFSETEWTERSKNTNISFYKPSNKTNDSDVVIVTKVQIEIVPKDFELDDKKPLGSENYPIKYHVWYANDNRVIRCEPMDQLHNMFTYFVGEYVPDMHHIVNVSMADMIDRMQQIITAFINLHIKAVKRVISNRLVVDPAGVDLDSLKSDDPYILLKRGKSQTGAERWVHQLAVSDTTGNHMNDADRIMGLVQLVTGANDNAMGQYNNGRRSATEARAVTSGAASRMKTQFTVIWDSSVAKLGEMMLANSRQSLGMESFQRVVGKADPTQPQLMDERYKRFQGTPEDIVGADDFFIFDTTLQSEKGYIAQSLQELMVAIIGNPQAAVMLDLDPKALLDEIQTLRGNGPMTRFSLQKRLAQQQATTPQPQLTNGPQPTTPSGPNQTGSA